MEKLCQLELMSKENAILSKENATIAKENQSDIRSLAISVNPSQSSASVNEEGLVLLESLKDQNMGIPSFGGVGDPVIYRGRSFPLGDDILKDESLVVKHLTPFLLKAVLASRGNRDLVLLNTERHHYLKSAFVAGADKAPDMLVCHRAAAEENKSKADRKYDSDDNDFLFGKLTNWNLRDMVSCVVEFKTTIGGKADPWGEMVHYASRWASTTRDSKADTAPKLDYMNWLLADAKCFYMMISNQRGNIVRALRCCWDDAGGSEMLGSFLCGGKLPNYNYHVEVSPWENALDWCLKELNLTLEWNLETGGMSYLGFGSVGRVFRVKTSENVSGALKITVGQKLVSSLLDEINRYGVFQHKHLSKLNNYLLHPNGLYGGLVSVPVGSKPDFSKVKTLAAAKDTLVNLLSSNIVHGDARRPNLLYDKEEENYFWVDLHTVRKVDDDNHDNDKMLDITLFEVGH